jgi:hypothetical protein
MIDFKDISVVVQGAVDFSIIDQVLLSVRTVLPEAEIILSTWEGVDYSPINSELYDKLVLSVDPGGFIAFQNTKVFNNVDRQVVSSFAGLNQSKRLYALKMRTDMVLTHANFLAYFDKYTVYQEEYKVVKSRMLNNASGAVDPFWHHPLHSADFLLFGYTEDVKAFFSASPFPEADKQHQHNTQDFLASVLLERDGRLLLNKLPPEMYLFRHFLLHHKVVLPEFGAYEISANSVATSYAYLVNNFVMLSDKQLGYRHLKYPEFEASNYTRGFTNLKWQKLYKLLCNPTYTLINEESDIALPLLCKPIVRLFQNNELSLKMLCFLGIVRFILCLKPRFDKIFRGILNRKKGYYFDHHEFFLTACHLHLVTLMLKDKTLAKGLEPFTNLDKKLK